MIVYADCETHPIARGALAPPPVCVQWAANDGDTHVQLWQDFDAYAVLRHATLVGANIAYDIAVWCAADLDLLPLAWDAYDAGRVIDVQLDAKLLDIASGEYGFRQTRGWNLQELARRAGVRIDKDTDDETGDGSWRLRFRELDGIPVERWPAGAVRYAAAEIPATRAVHRWNLARAAQWRERGVDPLGFHSAHAAGSAFALHLASCHGVLTDPERCAHVKRRLAAHIARTGRRLQRAGLVREDGTRNTLAAQRAMVAACERAGLEVPLTDGAAKKRDAWEGKYLDALAVREAKRSAGRSTRAADAAVEKLEAQWSSAPGQGVHLPGVKVDGDVAILAGSRVLELYMEYAGAGIVLGRVERMADGVRLPLQTRFDPLKETARTSSTQPSPPLVGEQMQNFPRASGTTPAERKAERAGDFYVGLRECFTPRPGCAFIVCDLPTAELRTLAQLCLKLFGFSRMAELINAGADLHVHLAMISLGLSPDDYDPALHKRDRDRAKPGNFGFPGGMGPAKFVLYSRKSYGVRFTLAEAKALKEGWLAAYPEMRPYLDWITRQLGDADTFTHVHPITGFVRGGCWYTSGANHGFQHLLAYGAKAGLYYVTRACFDPGDALFGCRPWGFVHDEVIAEAPLATAHEAATRMGEIMREQFNLYAPDVPVVEIEPEVSMVWSKKSKAVRDAAGLLVPWEPPPCASLAVTA